MFWLRLQALQNSDTLDIGALKIDNITIEYTDSGGSAIYRFRFWNNCLGQNIPQKYIKITYGESFLLNAGKLSVKNKC